MYPGRPILFAVITAALLLLAPSAAGARGFWKDLGADPAASRSRLYGLDATALGARLASVDRASAPAVIDLPLPDGRGISFRASPCELFAAEFARRHPELRTYRATAIDHPGIEARLDVTVLGIRAMIFTPEGTALIDPVIPGRPDRVRASWLRDAPSAPFDCNFENTITTFSNPGHPEIAALGDQLKTFTFILVAAGEYTQAVGSVPAALAQMTTSMNRIDAVLEREATTHLEVVQLLAFPDPATDPFATNDAGDILNRIPVVTDSIFGAGTYDMTQGISIRPGYAGRSFRPLFCYEGWTGQSAITGQDPFANLFDIKVMAHEIGHTLGCTHTQDTGNRVPATAYEPTVGWTIMTSPGDPASFGDAFFHVGNIEQMATTLSSAPEGGVCEHLTPTGNTPPSVEAGPDFTIPRSTPFVLTGSGSDPDAGDPLTYTWDEMDHATLANDPVNGPLFRWRPPTASPTRFFPALSTVLSGVPDPLEKLPNVDRTLGFRLVARDNHAGGGGVAWDSTHIAIVGAPFAVTFPNGGESLPSGASFGVTWAVGGGSVAASAHVMLSTDGGASWIPLAMNTPNDGAQNVLFSTGTTRTACRIRVSAVGNIFYDVSNSDFTILGDVTAVDPAGDVDRLAIASAAPNPVAGDLVVDYSIPHGGRARVWVMDVQGRRVAVLFDGVAEPGRHHALWASATTRSPGLYFVWVESGGELASRRVAVIH